MAQPSLAMIPAGYKATKLYSQLPVDGVGDFTVDRNSVATRVNADGLIETVGVNVPRLDYSNGSCPVLLCEPQSTNLITYSEDFTDASWSKSGTGTGVAPIITLNYAISPDGTQNANRVQLDCGGGLFADRSLLRQSEVTTTNPYTLSYYVKSNAGAGTQTIATHFNGALATTVLVTENEWTRVSYTDNGSGVTTLFGLELRGTITDNTADILVWGFQLEQLSYATSYIKTDGSTLSDTRLADEITGAGDSSTFNSSEGVLFTEIKADSESGFRYLSINSGSNANEILLGFSTENLFFRLRSNSSQIFSYTTSGIDILNVNKVLIKYKSGDWAVWVNGVELSSGSDAFTFSSSLNELELSGAAGSPFYGRIKQILTFNEALSDSELQSLTS